MDDTSRSSGTDGLVASPAALDEVASGPRYGQPLRVAGEPSAAAEAEASGFDAFYDAELPRLIALAQALAGPAVADDLAQDAMITAYRHWREISQYDNPQAWVRRVCANAAVSLLRRRAAEARALVRLSARPTALAEVPLDDAAAGFWGHVRRLPRRQAQAIALRYIYDLEVTDIADTMGCTVGTVKVHLSRARATLASRLAVAEEDPS